MIIEVNDEVFRIHRNTLELYQLFRLAREERHLLLTRPLWDDPHARELNGWLAQHQLQSRELLEQILEQSVRAYATGPSPAHRRIIRIVARGAARWAVHPPELPLDEACKLAEAPLKVIVENRRNDAAFLRACAPRSLRKRLEHAEEAGWLEFEAGGGLPEMIFRAKADGCLGQEHRAARLAIVYDSDAKAQYDPTTDQTVHDQPPRVKWGPSPKAREMRAVCERAAGSPFAHRLRRRSIENYVPGQVLNAWAQGKRDQHVRVNAFLGMTDEQRHYFNMKHGLAGDQKSGESPIYEDLSPADRAILQRGFDSLTDFFHEKKFRIEGHWMRDGQAEEIGPLIEEIIGLA